MRRVAVFVLGNLALIGVLWGCGKDDPSKPKAIVTVTPATGVVDVTEHLQFMAESTRAEVVSFTWSIGEGEGYGSISAEGLYTAPAILPDPPVATVVAVDAERPDESGSVSVHLVDLTPLGFVRVPAGSFTMGDGHPDSYCGSFEYPVTLTEDFYLGQTEVTNEEYLEALNWAYDQGRVKVQGQYAWGNAAVPGERLLLLESYYSEIRFDGDGFVLVDDGYGLNPDHPVKQVTFYGAVSYCNWKSEMEAFEPAYDLLDWECNGGDPYRASGYRLPTNAEWEYAAQFPDGRTYPWGETPPTSALANYGWGDTLVSAVKTHPAEKYIGGKGVYEMAGNLSEWTNDRGTCDSTPSSIDPVGAAEYSSRIYCGGNWRDMEFWLRCSSRYAGSPNVYGSWMGFRVARTVHP